MNFYTIVFNSAMSYAVFKIHRMSLSLEFVALN